jgi:hypothetical protein
MNIKKFASTPKLIEIIIDDKDLVETYGEAITFYTYDVVTMSTYFDFFDARTKGKFNNLSKLMKSLVLDDKGEPVLADDEDLPIDIATAVINKLGEILGKSQSKPSTPKVGKRPK